MFDVGQGQVRRDLAKLVGSLKEVLYLTMFFAEQAVAQTVEREKSGRVIVAFHSAFATAAVKAESAQGWAEMDERARYFRWKAFYEEASARHRQYLQLYDEDMRRMAEGPGTGAIPFRRVTEELLRVGGMDEEHQMLALIETVFLVAALDIAVTTGVRDALSGVRLT